MRQVDTILARYPGPVTLYPSRLKIFGMFLACVAFVAIAAFLLTVRPDDFDSLDALWTWLGLLFFGAGVVVFAALMLPGAASLTLAADGFEVCSLFRRTRAPWKDAGGFSVRDMRELTDDESTFKDRMIVFDILTGGSGPERRGATKVDGMLPDNYRLPKDDLAWLMNAWRARALQAES